jgi:general secretion pathway protein H
MEIIKKNEGFTLIELVVVITIISIMLGFAIPRFQNTFLTDSSRKASEWITLTVFSLKERALREQKQYMLHIDMNEDRLWVTREDMTEEEAQAAGASGYQLPPDIHLMDVEYPDRHRQTTGQVYIRFYKNGYSDYLLIHISNNDNEQQSFLIEPFLPHIHLYEGYVSFQS